MLLFIFLSSFRMIIERWVNELCWSLDHYELRCFGLSIQFNAFLVCSLFIPSQCHLCLLFTVFGCHEWWWIRINKVLRPSNEMNGVWVNSLVLSSSLVTQGSCQWINHDSDSSGEHRRWIMQWLYRFQGALTDRSFEENKMNFWQAIKTHPG